MDPFTIIKGISAVAGLFGSMKKKETGLDLAKLRRDAVASGFNPLTVLRTTGAQGYARANQPNPLLSIANFGADIAGVFESNQDRSQAKLESDARIGLMNSQVAAFGSPSRSGGAAVGGTPMGDFSKKPSHVIEQIMTDSGNVLDVPVGPDIDEIVSGAAINALGDWKEFLKTNRFGGFLQRQFRPDLSSVVPSFDPVSIAPPSPNNLYGPLRFDITVPNSPTPNRRQPFAPLTR